MNLSAKSYFEKHLINT